MSVLFGRRRMLARSAVTAAMLLVAVGGLLPSAHADASTVGVEIDSPAAGTVVSGTITFTVTVTQSDASDPVTSVEFGIAGKTEGWQQQDVSVPSGGCVPSCSVSATFDTSSLVKPASLLATDTNLSDGLAEFGATAWTSRGVNVSASTQRTIDNQRPQINLPDITYGPSTGQSTVVGGDTDIPLTAAVTPNAESSSPVTQIEFFVVGASGQWTDQTWTAPTGGTGQIDIDLTNAPVGLFNGYFVAIDAAGQVSSLLPLSFHIGHYSLAASDVAAYADDINVSVDVNWTDGTDASRTWIQTLRGYVDGQLVGSSYDFGHPHATDEVDLTMPNKGSFPLGPLTVVLKAVDNRGVPEELSVPVTVGVPVSAHWSDSAAVVGRDMHVSATVFSATTDDPIDAKLSLDGTRFAKVSPPSPTNNLVISGSTDPIVTPGTHKLRVKVTLEGGYTYTLTRTVHATQPVSLDLQAPASTAWNRQARVRVTAQSPGGPVSNMQIALWKRSGPSANWSYLAAATTDAGGDAVFKVNAGTVGTAEYQARSAVTPTLAAARSQTATIVAIPEFIGVPNNKSIHSEKVLKFEATTMPIDTRQHVALQICRPGSCTYRNSQKLIGDHTVFSHLFTTSGTYRLRFHRYADSRYGATNSPTWTVTVR